MGKPTGFMEYVRCNNTVRPPLERIKDWEEFHLPLDEETRALQGARCMNCGVPFCQAGIQFDGQTLGCPLHNQIPEWNDMIMNGNYGHALSRLLKTNNFPEFTGRVCPAFCEKACTCGLHDEPITVHDNELSIIETAFATGRMKPRFAPERSGKKVAVVGSGPSGLAVADQLNHRGHLVTVLEKDSRPGGILAYGIPNMKLPKAVVQRRIDLMTEEGVTFITDTDASAPENVKRLMEEYDAIVLCCGAERPRDLGVETDGIRGFSYAMPYLHASVDRQLFGTDSEIPCAKDRDVIIVGTGNTASDCVATAIRQGCRSVLQLVRRPEKDYLDAEGHLPQDYAQEEAEALFGSDPRRFATSVGSLVTDERGNLTSIVTKDGDTLPCDLLIGATGFAGCRTDVAERFGVETDRTVVTETGHYQTNVDKIFTAGDMHRGQSLVVWAISEGRAAALEVDEFLMGYTNL